jgi:2-succinyl-5-enolpyruvyl-6-hydroxy-3-cyclohexene-1-carboxylate synthase
MTQAQLLQQTLQTLADLGVREVCVAAGARNAPLVAALLNSRGVKIWNFFEERSAAFFALGRIMADRQPVAVVTTSGTAAAELLPATIEAHYQGLPLVLVTADRPKSYRGSGAPQAIEQFRDCLDAMRQPWETGMSRMSPMKPSSPMDRCT